MAQRIYVLQALRTTRKVRCMKERWCFWKKNYLKTFVIILLLLDPFIAWTVKLRQRSKETWLGLCNGQREYSLHKNEAFMPARRDLELTCVKMRKITWLVDYIAKDLRENLSKTLKQAYFVSVQIDGSTDCVNLEEELFLAIYFDPHGSDGSVHVQNRFMCVRQPELVDATIDNRVLTWMRCGGSLRSDIRISVKRWLQCSCG